MQRPSLLEIAALFFRIGNTTFGGGDPTMAALEREMVERSNWITGEQYGLCYSLARVTPGTNVLAFSAGAAWMVRGWLAAILAVMASSVPCAVLAVWLVHAYELWSRTPAVQAMVGGVVAAVVGMMAAGAVFLFRGQTRHCPGAAGFLRGLALAGGAALLAGVARLNPVWVLALAALAGLLWKEPRRA
jgi:chromate transporter